MECIYLFTLGDTPHDAVRFSIHLTLIIQPAHIVISSTILYLLTYHRFNNILIRSLLPKFFQVLVKHPPPFFFVPLAPCARADNQEKKFRFLGWVMTPLTKPLGLDDGVAVLGAKKTWQLRTSS
ncbi:hypothetical protein BDV30DRAFT_220562 [Aspergillus minisclerotigenes]|uniref:Uncharacterized protein n=1 Tax=Aspergillus minisclerotigenes TaxID=656917 RepID=A0A5N6ILW0_9EURO|nr:hypothetical protein BDV30DRAFT_220562 [Aspergillus minisclerotigenes]